MHIETYKLSQVKAMLKHYAREHLTKNIDTTRTKDNVYIYNDLYDKYVNACEEINKEQKEKNDKTIYKWRKKYYKCDSNYDFIVENITSRVHRKIRDDQNIILDLVVFQPKDIPNTDGLNYNKKFFDTMINSIQDYEWNGKKVFDKKNMVMATIHQDEKGSPHLHYCFMPIYDKELNRKRENKKKKTDKVYNIKGGERLTSDFMDEAFLNVFHKRMEDMTGYKLTHNDNEKRNLSMPEYQRQQELKKENEKIHENIKELEKEIKIKKEKEKELNKELEKKVDTQLEEKQNKLKEYNKTIDTYDYYYKTHNKIELQKPTELKPKITQNKETEILLNRQQYENMLKQVRDLEFATTNDYNKRTRLKEQYDKEIAEQEKKLENLKNENFIDYQNTIEYQKDKINELNTKLSARDATINNQKELLQDTKNQLDTMTARAKGNEKHFNMLSNFFEKQGIDLGDILDKLIQGRNMGMSHDL